MQRDPTPTGSNSGCSTFTVKYEFAKLGYGWGYFLLPTISYGTTSTLPRDLVPAKAQNGHDDLGSLLDLGIECMARTCVPWYQCLRELLFAVSLRRFLGSRAGEKQKRNEMSIRSVARAWNMILHQSRSESGTSTAGLMGTDRSVWMDIDRQAWTVAVIAAAQSFMVSNKCIEIQDAPIGSNSGYSTFSKIGIDARRTAAVLPRVPRSLASVTRLERSYTV
jgi:hypothetical protein